MKIVSPDGQFMYLVQSHFVWKHTNEGKAGGNKPSAFLWRSTLDSDATAVGANRSLVAVADRASLYVLNARDGKRLQKTPLARNVSLTRLVFTADGKAVVATTNRNKSIRFSAPPPDRN
jgi:outer membrane protein assembly factor BamB